MKVLKFLKDNFFAMFALIGAFIAAIISFSSSGPSKILGLAFENKKKSDREKLDIFKAKLKRVKEFQEVHDSIVADAEKKEEEITQEQREELETRRIEYFNADTPEKRQRVLDDIQNNFGDLNFVPLDSIATIENKDD